MNRLMGWLLTPLHWLVVTVAWWQERHTVRDAQERAWMDAVAACRAMPSDDTDHITIARQRNVFD